MGNEETYLVTGGAGFIGSHFVDYLLMHGHKVVVLDKLTYAGRLCNLKNALAKGITFVQGDINDTPLVTKLLKKHKIDKIAHFAAESHVDNSIAGSSVFIQTNIVGTHSLLQASLSYYNSLPKKRKDKFLFCSVSTDEVFGALGASGKFSEHSAYDPRSPYSSSKAAADHLVMAWHHTYKLPTIITHCSNNYGSRQHPEKLIPKTIKSIIDSTPIQVYGTGSNVRDWICVFDHCQGIYLAITRGKAGERYLFGGSNELSNLELIHEICKIADDQLGRTVSSKELIAFVEDRKGHDFRYAVDYNKANRELGFVPYPTIKLRIEIASMVYDAIKGVT